MTETTTAWLLVTLGTLGVMAGVLALTRGWPGLLRMLLVALAAVWLLLPWPIQVVDGHLAPAFIVALFEGLFNPAGNPWPAARALLVATLLVLGAAAGIWFWRRQQTD